MRAIKGTRVAPGWGLFDSTYETLLGSTPDANGKIGLSLDASARRIYVKNSGSNANSGLSDALAVQTLNFAYSLLRDQFGDWLMVDVNSTFTEGFVQLNPRRGLSAAFPTVVTTYDATDPSNAAKFRVGTFGFASSPTTDVLYMPGNQQWIYMENGRCLKPFATRSTPGTNFEFTLLGLTAGDQQFVQFYNFTFRCANFGIQGDNNGGYDATYDLTGNTTSGSASITGVTLVGGQTPTAGQHINGYGPLTGIPEETTIVSWTPGTSTLVMSAVATASKTAMRANFNAPLYQWKNAHFRHCSFSYSYEAGSGHACGLFIGTTDTYSVEDCVFYHNGYLGNRNDLSDITMNKTATASGPITVTFGGTGAGTASCTTTNGSAILTGVTLLSGFVTSASGGAFTGVTLTGTGIQASTNIAAIDFGISPDGFKHGLYVATNGGKVSGKVKRSLFLRNSSHGMQMRGGGQCSDNVYVKNPINLLLGLGDFYNVSRPYGVTVTGGHVVIMGSDDIDAGTSRGFGLVMGNTTPSTSFDKNIIANRKTSAGSPFNIQPFECPAQADLPTYANMSNSIVYGWSFSESLSVWLADSSPSVNPFPAQVFGTLLNNVTDGDAAAWNGVGTSSGNVNSGSFPNPTRDFDDFAVAQGYADTDAYAAFAIANPTVKHAVLAAPYLQSGFGH